MCHDGSDTCVDYIRANETAKKVKWGKCKRKEEKRRILDKEWTILKEWGNRKIRNGRNGTWNQQRKIVDEERKNKKGNINKLKKENFIEDEILVQIRKLWKITINLIRKNEKKIKELF